MDLQNKSVNLKEDFRFPSNIVELKSKILRCPLLNSEGFSTTAGLTGIGVSKLETAADHRIAVV